MPAFRAKHQVIPQVVPVASTSTRVNMSRHGISVNTDYLGDIDEFLGKEASVARAIHHLADRVIAPAPLLEFRSFFRGFSTVGQRATRDRCNSLPRK
jgi:hypothetical protein